MRNVFIRRVSRARVNHNWALGVLCTARLLFRPKLQGSSAHSQWSLVFKSLLHVLEYGIAMIWETCESPTHTTDPFNYWNLFFSDPRCQSEDRCDGVTPVTQLQTTANTTPATQLQTTANTKNTSSRSCVNYTVPNTPTPGRKDPGKMKKKERARFNILSHLMSKLL